MFVAGTFRSIRAFDVKSGRLSPMAVGLNEVYYEGGKWYDAECLDGGSGMSYAFRLFMAKKGFRHHPSKIEHWCTCGFHSFYDPVNAYALSREFSTWINKRHIIGVVENAGRVFHHRSGLRSERMRILGVCSFAGSSLLTRWCLRGSGVTVFKSLPAMLEAFPLSPRPE